MVEWEPELSRVTRALLTTLIHGDPADLDDLTEETATHGLAAVEVLQNYARLALFAIRDDTGHQPVDFLAWLDVQWDGRPSSSAILERHRRLALDILRGYLVPNPSRSEWLREVETFETTTHRVRPEPYADLVAAMAGVAGWCVAQAGDQLDVPAPTVLQQIAVLVETEGPRGM